MDYADYADLGLTGFKSNEPVKPEDEFFHSLYIAGASRSNHIGIVEQPGKFQIRGVEYNLDSVNMVITHVKKILLKNEKGADGKTKMTCFSFKATPNPPWFGWNNRPCGTNSAERATNSFCKDCREQIVLAGIYCDEYGSPILNPETKKPVFIFLRGKGMKYNNVSQYLADCYKMEIKSYLFTPPTAQSIEFEKTTVNNKRFVTNITKGKASSAFGDKDVFEFKQGQMLDNQSIFNVLEITKKSMDKFNEKFDWTKTDTTSGYTPDDTPLVNQSNVIPEANVKDSTPKEKVEIKDEPKPKPTFNFEDIKF